PIVGAAIERYRRSCRNSDAARRFQRMHFKTSYVIPEKTVVHRHWFLSFIKERRGSRRVDFTDRQRRLLRRDARSKYGGFHHQRLFIADGDRRTRAAPYDQHRHYQRCNTPFKHVKDLYVPASAPEDVHPADACEYDKLPDHRGDYSS